MDNLKVVIVTEYMNSIGGSDRVIESLLTIFPKADIYASVFNRKMYPNLKAKVYTHKLFSYLFNHGIGRRLSFFLPYIFEQFDLRKYDLVISVSAGPSKGIIPSVEQEHISIICTPPRHQWDGDINVRGSVLAFLYRFGSKILSNYLRIWDITASKRVDHMISISKFIQRKVYKTYRRDSEVIYPGIKDFWFKKVSDAQMYNARLQFELPDHFNLVVSRLYDYKRVDWAIRASIEAGENLVIVGGGPDANYLKRIVEREGNGKSKVIFLGMLSDSEIRTIYKMADSLLFCGIEDFGLIPVESLATGTPVLAFGIGGTAETIEDGRSGFHFTSYDTLVELIRNQAWKKISAQWCIIRAQKFTESDFISNISKYIQEIYEKRDSA